MLNSNLVTDSLYTETDPSSVGRNAIKAKMQSARLQYVLPDDKIKGQKNRGIIA